MRATTATRVLPGLAAIALAACSTSHATVDRTDCNGCHASAYDTAPVTVSVCTQKPDHAALGYPRTCSSCHGTTAWCPADATHTSFDIVRQSHAGWDCADCHVAITYDPPAIADPAAIDCTNCHWHDQARVDPNHLGKSDYRYGPATCRAAGCHGGRGR